MLSCIVNGEPYTCAQSLTLEQLVQQLNLSGRRFALERNGELVPKSQHAHVQLREGDRIELVMAVGGG